MLILTYIWSTRLFRGGIFDTEVCGYWSWGAIPIFAGSESAFYPMSNTNHFDHSRISGFAPSIEVCYLLNSSACYFSRTCYHSYGAYDVHITYVYRLLLDQQCMLRKLCNIIINSHQYMTPNCHLHHHIINNNNNNTYHSSFDFTHYSSIGIICVFFD